MRLTPASRRPGLSLLEVLGATAIFLLSIVAIGELMSASTDQAQEVMFRSRATRLAQSKLNDFATGVEQLNGATSGQFDEDTSWSWQADVVVDSNAANLYKVTVTVSREYARGPIEISMSQYIFDPAQRGSLTGTSTSTDSGSGSGTGGGTTGGSATSGGKSGTSGGGTSGGGSGGGKGGGAGGGGAGGGGGGIGGGGTGGGGGGGAGGGGKGGGGKG